MAITTKRGDYGETDLMFGRRVPKDHPRVVAVGAIDELNANPVSYTHLTLPTKA